MRIQETDRILKEARYQRHAAGGHEPEPSSMLSRAWHAVSSLPAKVMGMIHR